MDDDGAKDKYNPNIKPTPPPPSSSSTPPRPPRTTPANAATGSGTKRPITPGNDSTKSGICPVCKKDLCHEKALNGHIRWHSLEEREAAGIGIARALATGVVVRNDDAKMQGPSKRAKVIPDLNRSPPPEDEDNG